MLPYFTDEMARGQLTGVSCFSRHMCGVGGWAELDLDLTTCLRPQLFPLHSAACHLSFPCLATCAHSCVYTRHTQTLTTHSYPYTTHTHPVHIDTHYTYTHRCSHTPHTHHAHRHTLHIQTHTQVHTHTPHTYALTHTMLRTHKHSLTSQTPHITH